MNMESFFSAKSSEASFESLFEQGLAEYEAGRYEPAIALFNQCTELYPQMGEAWLNLGNAHFRINHLPAAEQAWRQAIDLNPLEHNGYLNLGNLYFKKEQYLQAVEYWELFKQLKPGHQAVWLNLGIAYEQLHDIEKALEHYHEYICLDITSSEARQLQKRFESAKKVFEGNLQIGEKALKAGNLARAREAFEKALPLYPGTAKVYRTYAALLYRLGNPEEALVYFEKSYLRSPETSAGALVNMGVMYEKKSCPEKPFEEKSFEERAFIGDAVWAYQQALELPACPDKAKVQARLEKLLGKHPDVLDIYFSSAQKMLQNANNREAEKMLLRLEAVGGRIPHLCGEIRKALQELRLRRDPKLKAANSFYQLAEHAVETGKYHQALAYYNKFLTLETDGSRAETARRQLESLRQRIGAVIGAMLNNPSDTISPS